MELIRLGESAPYSNLRFRRDGDSYVARVGEETVTLKRGVGRIRTLYDTFRVTIENDVDIVFDTLPIPLNGVPFDDDLADRVDRCISSTFSEMTSSVKGFTDLKSVYERTKRELSSRLDSLVN